MTESMVEQTPRVRKSTEADERFGRLTRLSRPCGRAEDKDGNRGEEGGRLSRSQHWQRTRRQHLLPFTTRLTVGKSQKKREWTWRGHC